MDFESFRRLSADSRGKVISNKYEIRAGIGFGTFGAVFLAYERLKRRHVALKRVVVSREDLSAVTREIESLEILGDSRNVVQYLGYAIEEPAPEDVRRDPAFFADKLYFYLAMQFGGISLEAYLQRHGAEAYREKTDPAFWRRNEMLAVHLIKEVLAGLRDAHERRFVHRDVKPANIYLDLAGNVRLGDFGVAKQLMQEGPSQGTIVGTVFYMAPEQIAGESYDLNVDLFSAGVVLYRMLTGRMPFANLVQIRTKEPHLEQEGIFPGMREILARSLAKDPGQRYRAAQDMINDLEDYEVGLEPVGLGDLLAQLRENVRALLPGDLLEVLESAPGTATGPAAPPAGSLTATPIAPPAPGSGVDEATRVVAPPPRATATPSADEITEVTRVGGFPMPPTAPPQPPRVPPRTRTAPPTEPPPPAARETPRGEPPVAPAPAAKRKGLLWIAAAAVILVLGAGAGLAWWLWPRQVELRIFCDQPARVFIDGQERGLIPPAGPFVTKVDKGQATKVRLVHHGFQDVESIVEPGRGILDVKMTPEARPTTLEVSVNLRDAVLRVDGRIVTDPPAPRDGRFVWAVEDLPPGAHEVEATLPGSEYAPARGQVTLAEGKTETLRLDLVPGEKATLFVAVTGEGGRPIDGFELRVNGRRAEVDAMGRVAGDFTVGERMKVEVAARGYRDWSRDLVLAGPEERLTAALARGEVETPPEPVPAARSGEVLVTARGGGRVFVNGRECGNAPVSCKLPGRRGAEILVINSEQKTAWQKRLRPGEAPETLAAQMAPCTRTLVLDWKPWAYIDLFDDAGRKVPLAVSALESRPQTPKRVTDLACGVYRASFSNDQGPLATTTVWLRPSDPATVRAGNF